MSVTKKQRERKSPKQGAERRGKGDWKGFLEVELTATQKAELREMDLAVEFPLSLIKTFVAQGYKLSFGLDKDEVTYRAALTDVDPVSPMCGYTLTGRGGDVDNAFASLLYKHQHILTKGWEAHQPDSDAPDFA